MNKWRKIMDRKNIKLVIDGNDVYELDLECIRRKQKKKGQTFQKMDFVLEYTEQLIKRKDKDRKPWN